MITTLMRRSLLLATACIPMIAAIPAQADAPAPAPSLEQQFRDPPNSARPRLWWHWMNGNITKDGIAKDLDWMHRIGIGGLQNFDANLMTPQIVPHRLVYMTPEWQDAFRFAVSEADRLGIEFGIASSPGWSETGGPWVPPADGLKKLVWSETLLAPGKRVSTRLPAVPMVTGPYQTLRPAPGMEALMGGKAPPLPEASGEIGVFAVPVALPVADTPHYNLGGKPIDAASLGDFDPNTGLDVPAGTAAAPTAVVLGFDRPQTMRSLTFFASGARMIFGGPSIAPVLEASDDGSTWRKVADVEASAVPTTISFAPVTAAQFRIVLHPLSGGGIQLGGAPGTAPLIPMGMMGPMPIHLRELRLSGEARIDEPEAKAGFAIAQDYFALPQVADGARGAAPAQVIDITSHVAADGTLDWTPPRLAKGQQWRVVRLGWSLLGTTNHPATAEATGLEVDKFDGAAVQRYMDHYLAMYRQTVGPEMFGARGIRSFLTDSIEVGAANWTPKMVEQFKRLRGYDPTPWLPALTGTLIGSRGDSDRFLYDYRRTLADLMASEHYGTVDNAARAAGLTVYGEALEDHRPSLGDDMAMRSHTDIPMSAMWTFPEDGKPKPTYLADIKGAASVAHIYGQNLVAAESMTSVGTPWADSPRTLKHVIDLEFLAGVNRPVIHESTHQPLDTKVPGLSLFIFGQYFNRLDSWAELAKPWVDYIARNAFMLQQGRNVADVGYFYGEEAPLTGLYGDQPVADAPTTSAYDFVNADALMSALANDGDELVTPGGARYKALYLGGSSSHMTLATLRRVGELVEGGATIVGLKPDSSPSLVGDDAGFAALTAKLWSGAPETRLGKGRVIASSDIEAALRAIGVGPDFHYDGGQPDADIRFVHRKLAEGDSYFVVNRRLHPETIAAHFRVTGKAPELWHAETGLSEPVSYRIVGGETIVPLALAAEESVHVVFRKAALADALAVPPSPPVTLARLDGPWQVSFQPGRGAPASTTLPALAPLEQNGDPGIKYFSGIATYAHDFVAPRGWKPGQALWLDLGDVHEIAEVSVDGKLAGTAWHAPFRVDIGRVTHGGKNHLAVRVANLWINRLIGDAQPAMQKPGAVKITWTPLPTYLPDAPMHPSGLLGPVTLLGAGK